MNNITQNAIVTHANGWTYRVWSTIVTSTGCVQLCLTRYNLKKGADYTHNATNCESVLDFSQVTFVKMAA